MATIFLSMSGEGRGHATRVRALVEALRHEHRLVLFASGDAFELLHPLYGGGSVRVQRIPGLRFEYRSDGRLDYLHTLRHALGYVRRLPALVPELESHIAKAQPDLVITDFEPALPRAAKRRGVPFLSLNHQHFLAACDLASVPARLRWHALYMAAIVRAYYSGQCETIVSSFYRLPLRSGTRNTTQVGVLLRPGVLHRSPFQADHLVAYWRRYATPAMLEALAATGREVRVYGLGARPSLGRLSFRPIQEERFLDDLASCAALIGTAGNQLVGEAMYLGKPILAMPEPNNFEQYINAHFIQREGAGQWLEPSRFDRASVAKFLAWTPTRPPHRIRTDLNGLPVVLERVRWHLRDQAAPSFAAAPLQRLSATA